MVSHISVKGARQHNLKNIDIDIPKRTLTVITGLSGSGKSSLAFDTIYAEGQRRFVESLSAYARQFLNVANKPDVDSIDGLSPAIAIDQKTTSKNPRSTVGTITEIHDYLRLMYAQVGTPHCPNHDVPIQAQTVSQMVDSIMTWPDGTRLQVVAPVVRGRKGEYKKELLSYQKQGFTRVRINGEVFDIADAPELNKNLRHEIDVIVDRLAVRQSNIQRLAESLETALKLADGLVHVEPVAKDGETDLPDTATFSEKYACHICGHAMPDLEPRLFSFNSPYGACKSCDGLGDVVFFNPDLIIDKTKSLRGGAIKPWPKELSQAQSETLNALAKHYKIDLNVVFGRLAEDVQNIILHGSGDEAITFAYKDAGQTHKTTQPFEGVIPRLERAWAQAKYPWQRDELGQYRSAAPCPVCEGQRLNRDALSVKIQKHNIHQFGEMSIAKAKGFFDTLLPKLTEKPHRITAFEGLENTAPVIGSGLARGKEEQLANLAREGARLIQEWLAQNQDWFVPDPDTPRTPFDRAAEKAKLAALN